MNNPAPGLDAGSFTTWLAGMRAVLRGERDADVPCGGCVGCCVSSYPIPLRATDREALAHVPDAFLTMAYAESGSRAVMGFRSDGSCPMLVAGRCSIYADRPRTCRDYDCRIYAAAGLLPDGDRPVIRERVALWQTPCAVRRHSSGDMRCCFQRNGVPTPPRRRRCWP